jgi:fumarate reductase (CoM/CoB) subunit A
VKILVEESADEVRQLERFGGQFLKDGERYRISPSGDHSRPRVIVPANHIGTDFTVPMAAYAVSIGVRPMEFTMALELLVEDGRVVGAICLDTKAGTLMTVRAAATILATGGCGRLFRVTSNPKDVTGDGFALALRAGAEMRDMEFIQFYPWRCIDPFKGSRMPIQPSTFVLGARLYNSEGKRFMRRFDPERGESTTRDVAARGIYDQIRNGLGVRGGVRLDLSPLSEEDFKKSNPKVWRGLQPESIDYRTYEFIVAPECHYYMGGVRIDEEGQSSMPGLFAAGEVAGGIQGANRLNSNALPETQIWGRRAGQAAAKLTREGMPEAAAGEQIARWERVRGEVGGANALSEPGSVLQELQSRMELSLGIVRNAAAMEEGLVYLKSLRGRLEESRPAVASALRELAELQFLCDVGEMCLIGALSRKESRGAHYREDYPQPDDAWRRTIILRRKASGGIEHRIAPTGA